MPKQKNFWTIAAVVVVIFTLIANVFMVLRALSSWDRNYTYLEFDFPPSLIPLSQHPYNAELVIEDSVYYAPNETDEWHSQFPSGGGFVRLGPNYRLFGVSMFHQLHCLDKMRTAITMEPPTEWEKWHTQHCLNYVRQMLLCAANVRLEPVKVSEEGLKVDGLGVKHVCRDWSSLYELAEKNYETWPADIYP
ncbi:hypothetical protein DFH07DRAFT_900915 [Mycena maculata]|uniref:Oxidase ustYa n=1 Tax=Mycena maculata TaxID=230809 RepID=A0AAD7KB31_9AGAR|nr:hypothetical protein DFH07DRAFT_900915 [Mycena maculata]